MKKIRVAVVGYGNIGQQAVETVIAAPDMELAGVILKQGAQAAVPPHVKCTEDTNLAPLGKIDAALLCVPTRQVENCAKQYLSRGIHTVDSFDIHSDIAALRQNLTAVGKQHGTVSVIAAGWDPGSDSVIRALLEAAAPIGITYTDFGPGMSMGHTVVAKSKPGVEAALSLTIPLGTGIHRRMVYVQLEEGASLESVTQAIKADPYFSKDETHVMAVADVMALTDKGHGVHLTRKGRSGAADNQLFTFDMRVNNPALTAQVMTSCARACMRLQPGAYTLIEIPLIDLLPGPREAHIHRLV